MCTLMPIESTNWSASLAWIRVCAALLKPATTVVTATQCTRPRQTRFESACRRQKPDETTLFTSNIYLGRAYQKTKSMNTNSKTYMKNFKKFITNTPTESAYSRRTYRQNNIYKTRI